MRVSPFGLGLAALGRPGYINLGHAEDLARDYDVEAMRRRAFETLDVAFDAGVRYFDAARSYGRGEEFLADWLAARGFSTDEIVVGSKWGYTYTAGWRTEAERHEVKEHTLPVLERQVAESRALLGPRLKLYQIHSATIESGVLERVEVLRRLAELRGEGLRIGLSVSGPRQAETLERAMAARVDGRPLFEVAQATWNVLEPSAGATLAAARSAGLGVIVKEALANGRLTRRNPDPEALPLLDRLERGGASADAAALAVAASQPWAEVVLGGAASPAQARSNFRAAGIDPPPIEEFRRFAEPPERYWKKRSALPWN